MRNARYTIAILLLLISISSNAQHWAVLKSFPIKSPGWWDYLTVSPLNNHLYVSHGTQVNILDENSGDSLGVIEGTTGVHGIAFAPAFNKGFISNGRLNNVFVFDGKTNQVTDSIRTGGNPDAMCYDSYSRQLIVGNGRSNDLTIINAANNQVVANIPLGGAPESSVSDGKGRVYVDVEDKNEVAVLDMKTMKITARYKLKGGEEPAGLAYDRKTQHLFVGCGNSKLVILDAMSGKQIGLLSIGEHCDGVAFDAITGDVFAANGAGSLTVIHGNEKGTAYSVIATVPTMRSARTLTADERTHQVFLPAAEYEASVNPKERPKMIPGTFRVLVVGRQ